MSGSSRSDAGTRGARGQRLEIIETERLICERLRPAHGPELAELLCDPRVGRWMWPEQTPPTHDEIVHGIRSKVEHWERFGFGLWLLRDRRTGAMIGRGGLQHTFVAGLHEVEVAWAIVPGRWGEGLATELAHASLNAAFHTLALPTVIAFTLPTNIASLRVMEKSGFIYEREIEHAGLAHVLYRATAGEASRDGRGERDRSRVARTLTTRRRDAEADDRCRGGRS